MKKKILVIDDEASIRNLLTQALGQQDYDVYSAASGREGKRVLKEITPDLVISDLQMEDTDGFSLIEELKALQPNVPIMLLTGVIFDPETIQETINKKISAYLQKTAPLKTILEEVARLVKS